MTSKTWHRFKWPEGVPHEISGYDKPLFSILDDSARSYPNATYTIFADSTRTFAQVKNTADRLAGFLVSRGIKQGDRVAIFLPNLPHYPEVFFGILKAGGICVTCNPLYKVPELNFQLKDCGAKAVFVMDHPAFYPTALQAMEGASVETVVICNVKSYLPKLKGFLGSLLGKVPKADRHDPGHFFYDDVVGKAQPAAPEFKVNPLSDGAVILYTGGTTGVPKGACLSHANLVSNLMSVQEWVRISKEPGVKPEKLAKGRTPRKVWAPPFASFSGFTPGSLEIRTHS
ncbi:MAG: AMP-binding protein [Desulfatiglandales bacterium]